MRPDNRLVQGGYLYPCYNKSHAFFSPAEVKHIEAERVYSKLKTLNDINNFTRVLNNTN